MEDNINKLQQYYDKYRDSLDEIIDYSEKELDKMILAIASGAFGISFSLISFLIPFTTAKCKLVLIIGWFVLCFCIIIKISCQIISKRIAERTIKDIDDLSVSQSEEENYSILRTKIIKRQKFINIVNGISTLLLMIGIVLILIFVMLNIKI